jgi:putative phosphoesterase
MIRIGILSDTHGRLLPKVLDFLNPADEIWHAGDIGSLEVIDELRKMKPLRAVYGNIDVFAVRQECRENLLFEVEKLRVFMTHTGGYPGKYTRNARQVIEHEKPGLFVCGHSHILKVIYDKKNDLLHINPGAAGNYGMHKSITAIRLIIDGKEMKDLEVLDIPR